MSAEDLERDVLELAEIGADGPAVTRLAWSPELHDAYQWMGRRMAALGLDVEVDDAGNLIGRWQVGSGRAVVVGSHLDTVPRGGRYDGALGVLAGLHAIAELRRRHVEPRRPVWLIAFMDEEGVRFGTSFFGSRAFCGDPTPDLEDRRDQEGIPLVEAMTAFGCDAGRLGRARGIDGVGAFLELHIEQGPVLESAGCSVARVTDIVGLSGFRLAVTGVASHAGTTPMDSRRDALVGASRIVIALREWARQAQGLVATVGAIVNSPNAYNVVPARTELTVDIRSADPETLMGAEDELRRWCDEVAGVEGVSVTCDVLHRVPPIRFEGVVASLIEEAFRREEIRPISMQSGAGHDAMVLGRRVPTAMLFVPSRGGVSHSADEFTDPESCRTGAHVVSQVLERLAQLDERQLEAS